MKIEIQDTLNYEIVHFVNGQKKIFSKFNKIYVIDDNGRMVISLPVKLFYRPFGFFRLFRRLLRLDKMVVLPTESGLSIFWQNKVYYWDENLQQLNAVLFTPTSRNPLHNSVVCIDGKELYFGEYGRLSPNGKAVYKSMDGGKSWQEIARFKNIKHIHSCRLDPVNNMIWVFCGDFEGQCKIYLIDRQTDKIKEIGDGSQKYRSIDASFKTDQVIWWMDSPLEDVYQISYNRETGTIEKGQMLPGPVWYKKELSDGITLISTAQEIGPSHKDKYAHIMASLNLSNWEDVMLLEHDGLKKGYFKFATIAFSDGEQSSDSFYIHAEAVKQYDGKVLKCKLVSE